MKISEVDEEFEQNAVHVDLPPVISINLISTTTTADIACAMILEIAQTAKSS
jgi:hypothetical protein